MRGKDDGCPCGWYRFKTSCFLFADVNLTWEDSRVYCQLHYGHLAEVDTEAEDAFIRSVVLTIPDLDRVWLGGSDLIKEDEWIWNTSGLVISSYSNWDDGQPDNSGDQGSADCLCMRQWADFLWTDTECTAAGMPICETRYHKRI
ncbi:perlucin-like [Ylistrum balloti]|uniref:perlucin-like n=1 Tax=Ylistrum balloti TaxID=509963 RepID=UPI002905A35F|nr:perlucin-like [Ylistrum balloti]XP_060085831.1 perlucin-like [Ylistrum balloti]